MSIYDFVLFFHVLMVLITFGAAGVLHTAMISMRSADTAGSVRSAAQLLAKIEPLFPISALLLFAAGAYLVHSSWGWSEPWIVVSIVGLVIMEVVGGVILKKEVHRLVGSLGNIPDEARPTPAVRAAVLSPASWMGAHFNSAVATGIVFLMIAKPSTAVAVGTLVLFAALGIASAIPFTRPVRARV